MNNAAVGQHEVVMLVNCNVINISPLIQSPYADHAVIMNRRDVEQFVKAIKINQSFLAARNPVRVALFIVQLWGDLFTPEFGYQARCVARNLGPYYTASVVFITPFLS